MANIFSIGQSALSAAQAGLSTAGNNIANVSTQGYSRQEVVQTSLPGQPLAMGYVGQGTKVAEVRRLYNDYLGQQLSSAQSTNQQLQVQYTQIQPLDQMLSDSTSGLAPALQDFFNRMQDVASAPADAVARQTLLSSASALSANFNEMDNRLQDLRQGVNQQLAASVDQINVAAKQLASLNEAIVTARNTSGGAEPNDLLDQRDQLVRDLSQQTRVRVSEQGGSFSLFIGNGQPLVIGGKAYGLKTETSKTDPQRLEVHYDDSSAPMRSEDFGGGELGGLLQFRDQTLEPTQNALGRIALGLASAVNAQHQQGVTLGGAAGGDFFSLPPIGVDGASTNQGDAQLGATLTDAGKLDTSNYRLQRVGDSYRLLRDSDQQLVKSSTDLNEVLAASADAGFTLTAAGTMRSGDEFLIRPTARAAGEIRVAIHDTNAIAAGTTAGAVGDNSNMLKLAELQSAKVLAGGTQSYQSAYSRLVGQVGSKASELKVTSAASAQIESQAERSLQDVSGVNLDEEAAKLIRYQQSYQAAGKVIQLAKQLFETVLSISQ